MTKSKKQILKLNGKTAVFVDWANVYNWKKSLKKEPNSKQIFKYLKNYKDIKNINFYYGLDDHPKSKKFLKEVEKIGYQLYSKDVKYIKIEGTNLSQRKCDFDIEICMSVYEFLEKDFKTFIFFSGDGDFAPLYQFLIEKRKQVIVVFEHDHLGKEIWNMKKGVFKTKLSYLI